MGNSLYNKIYLGRRHVVLNTKRVQALLAVGAVVGATLLWVVIRALK